MKTVPSMPPSWVWRKEQRYASVAEICCAGLLYTIFSINIKSLLHDLNHRREQEGLRQMDYTIEDPS